MMSKEGEFPTSKTRGFPARCDELGGRPFSRAVPLLQAPGNLRETAGGKQTGSNRRRWGNPSRRKTNGKEEGNPCGRRLPGSPTKSAGLRGRLPARPEEAAKPTGPACIPLRCIPTVPADFAAAETAEAPQKPQPPQKKRKNPTSRAFRI